MNAGLRPPPAWSRLALAIVLLSVGPSCRQPGRTGTDRITVGIVSSPNSFDPRVGTDEASQRVHQLIFDPLLRIDEHLRVVPWLATGYDMPDSRTYRVSLRRGVRFHDGRELTSADVAYTFGSLIDPRFVSARKGAYGTLASVTPVDRYTVEFHLREPFGSFPVNLVMGIVPEGWDPATQLPIGTGPYRFSSFAVDDQVVLDANRDYFDGSPANAGVVLKVVPDDIMRGLELEKGTVDLVVNDLAPDVVFQLEHRGRLRIVRAPGTDYAYVGINMRDPLLADRRVRHALGYAIDRDAIVTYLRRGLATPAIGVLPPASWAFEPEVFTFTRNLARAKALLDQAGLKDPDGPGPRVRAALSLKASSAEFNRLQSAVIQQNLREIGIELDVRTYEFQTLYADVLKGNFQLFTLQWVGVSDPDMLRRVFHSRQMPPTGFNRGHYANVEVDRLIDQATVETDETRRRELYGRVQQVVAEDAPYLSLWYKVNVAVAGSDLSGIRLAPSAEFSFLRHVSRTRHP